MQWRNQELWQGPPLHALSTVVPFFEAFPLPRPAPPVYLVKGVCWSAVKLCYFCDLEPYFEWQRCARCTVGYHAAADALTIDTGCCSDSFLLLASRYCHDVHLSGTRVHCDHMVHVSAYLSVRLDSTVFWHPGTKACPPLFPAVFFQFGFFPETVAEPCSGQQQCVVSRKFGRNCSSIDMKLVISFVCENWLWLIVA